MLNKVQSVETLEAAHQGGLSLEQKAAHEVFKGGLAPCWWPQFDTVDKWVCAGHSLLFQ